MTQAFNLAQLANNLNSSGQVDATDGMFGVLPVANGGSGQSSLTANNVLLGNGTNAVQFVAPSTSGNVLVSNGTTWQSGVNPSIGNGQTWKTYNSSQRNVGITYTNTTNKPIMVVVSVSSGTVSGNAFLYIDGLAVNNAYWTHNIGSISSGVILSGIVPPGISYYVSFNSTWNLQQWAELN